MFAKCAAAAACCLIAMVTSAQASGACLTIAEARQRFPTSHLYWHGKDHCWDALAVARHASIARPVRPHERRALSAEPAEPSNETATIGLSSSPVNARDLEPASAPPGLRLWSKTMAMVETLETTAWIDRWPDQPIKPPSRPVVVAEAAADAALASPRGMVAGVMVLLLSLALLEILFGGTDLRTRLTFDRKNLVLRWTWAAARRVVPSITGGRRQNVRGEPDHPTSLGAIIRRLARLLPTFANDRGWKRSRSDIMVK